MPSAPATSVPLSAMPRVPTSEVLGATKRMAPVVSTVPLTVMSAADRTVSPPLPAATAPATATVAMPEVVSDTPPEPLIAPAPPAWAWIRPAEDTVSPSPSPVVRNPTWPAVDTRAPATSSGTCETTCAPPAADRSPICAITLSVRPKLTSPPTTPTTERICDRLCSSAVPVWVTGPVIGWTAVPSTS